MGSVYLVMLFAGLAALLLLSVMFIALQQDEHRRTGLSRLAAAREVFLERVYEMSAGWRLVFRGGSTQAFLDVRAWHLVAPAGA